MKKVILYSALAIAALSGCRKIETDGEKEIIIVNGGGTGGSTGQTITLKGRITKDTLLKKENTYILEGPVYVAGGAKMTIEAGTTVKGQISGASVSCLVITRGSQIIANGTATAPIIFTSNSPNPRSGDWGGIVLLGKANVNTTYTVDPATAYPQNPTAVVGLGTLQIEGGVDNTYADGVCGGGATPDLNDNSGVLRYVRIEYAGYAQIPDKELNSLTLGAVGKGTTIEYVQVTFAKDDAFEWFGGNVNCKYLVAWKTQDDDLDTDNGYSGTVQFALVVRDSLIADVSNSEAFESDNNAQGSALSASVLYQTNPIFSNVTAIGPRTLPTNVGNSLFLAGAQIRRNSALSIFNSVIMGWPRGLLIDASTGRATDLNINDSTLRVRNTIISGCAIPVKYTVSGTAATGATDVSITDWYNTAFHGNRVIATNDSVGYTRPFDYSNPDFTPFGAPNVLGRPNPIINGFSFADPKINASNTAITPVTFRGAIAPSGEFASWYKGWCKFTSN